MAELDERVAHLETSMEDQKQLNADLRADMKDLRADMKDLRVEMRSEFANVRAETRAEFGRVWAEIRDLRSTMERGFERIDRRFELVDQKFDKQFMWLVGIMVTTFMAGFATMVTLFMRVLERLS